MKRGKKRIKKRNKKVASKIFSTLFFVVLVSGMLGFLYLLIRANLKVFEKRRLLNEKALALQKEIERLLQEKKEMEEKLENIQNEAYLEKIAREELNLKKEGEKVVAFPVISEDKRQEIEEKKKNFWNNFLKKIKIKNKRD